MPVTHAQLVAEGAARRDPLPDALRIASHPALKLAKRPNWIDANTRSSDQPLGDATVAVVFEGGSLGFRILGVDLDTGFVPAILFDGRVLEQWTATIGQELIDEAAQVRDQVLEERANG